MHRNEKNLRFQSELYQLRIYQSDMLAVLRLKTISDSERESLMAGMMDMHRQIISSLERAHAEWAKTAY